MEFRALTVEAQGWRWEGRVLGGVTARVGMGSTCSMRQSLTKEDYRA